MSPSVRPTRSRLRSSATSRTTKPLGVEAGVGHAREHVESADELRLASAGSANAASFSFLGRQREHRPPAGDDEEHDAALVERPADVDRAGLHLRPHPRAGLPTPARPPPSPGRAVGHGRRCGTAATASWGCRTRARARRASRPRVTVRPASKNSWTICSIRPRSPSTAHSASSSPWLGPAARHRAQVLLDVDVARRHADGAGVEAARAGGRTSPRPPRRSPAGGRRRRARTRRSTEWPTSGATLSARSAASASTMPSNDSPQRQSTPCSNAAAGISSMSRNMREKRSRCGAAHGRHAQRAVAGDDGGDAVLDRRDTRTGRSRAARRSACAGR